MKAILIVDMPKSCEDCELCRDFYLCLRLGEVDESVENGTKDLRCPLRPITDVIPVEYIKEWFKRDDDFWSPNVLDYFNKLYDDWRKENEQISISN